LLFLNRWLLVMALLPALARAQETGVHEIRVAAASDLSAAMQKLTPVFEKQTGIHVSVSLGSSGNFFAQISNGAPFDVFLSADKSYPEKLDKSGLAEPGTIALYARGKLAIWWPNSVHPDLQSKNLQGGTGGLDSLKLPEIHRIAIANPEHAPYGRAAVAALQHYGIYEAVQPKLVLGENISQTAQFAQSGNADVAFIALALAVSDAMKDKGQFLLLPESSYPPLDQAAVVVRSSPNKQQARRFVQFLTSSEGQKILSDFGFGAPQK
jgi:molybdate transport system substrate-binding protein